MDVRGGRRLDSLTGLRAVAAFAVFAYHAGEVLSGSLGRQWNRVFQFGNVGVEFFFALSGFVLAWTWSAGDSALPFYRRRFARIYPAYLVALLVAVPLSRHELQPGIARHFVLDAVLLQSWVPHATAYFSINNVAWTLSCEAFFYATFPLWLPRARRLTLHNRRALAATAYLSLLLLQLVAGMIGGAVSIWAADVLPLGQTMLFALGALVALELRDGTLPKVPFRLAAVWFVAAYAVATAVPGSVRICWLVPPIVACVIAAAQADLTGARTVFATPRAVFLGEISYCFYLIHYSVLRVGYDAVGTRGGVTGLLFVAMALGLSVAGATALHRLVERPLEARLKGGRLRNRVDDPEREVLDHRVG